jgi:hypothetical protein
LSRIYVVQGMAALRARVNPCNVLTPKVTMISRLPSAHSEGGEQPRTDAPAARQAEVHHLPPPMPERHVDAEQRRAA